MSPGEMAAFAVAFEASLTERMLYKPKDMDRAEWARAAVVGAAHDASETLDMLWLASERLTEEAKGDGMEAIAARRTLSRLRVVLGG